MSEAASIGVQPWMRAPETTAVMAALEATGGRDCARFVGGCVRNAIRGEAVADIDIATTLTPDRVAKALTDAGLKAVPTGVEHGTITAVAGGKPFEVTTLRRDVETDGRHAVVAFTTDWAEDAARRDFRLNAIYADADGRLYDPTGEGVADARAGRVVFVGDAASTPRPHLGFGVAKAGAEAQALAEALGSHDDIDRALVAYNAARQPLSERIVAHGRKLGTQLGVNLVTDEDFRMSKLLQRPEAMLELIAVPDFLANQF
jgi:2-polyprenyl-6-methoxyphenol hydroxylase-like FAD-dependent oxidoreductase